MTQPNQVQQGTELKEATAEGIGAAFSGPAIFSNHFYVTVGPCVRISFMEQHDPESLPIFRSAVVLTLQDAIKLKQLLHEMLKEPEEQLKKFVEEVGSAEQKQNG